MALIGMRGVSWGVGGTPLLENIHLQVEQGERVCLVGRNGLGKSTVLRLLNRVIKPDSGEIWRRPNATVGFLGQEVPENCSGSVFDVVVGINLLREGLDLPEVSLVAILDADKQGFLRSGTALIQTIGRAARHLHGEVIMYADRITDAMKHAIDETNRRREIQIAYNKAHHIEPASVVKSVRDLTDRLARDVKAESGSDIRGKASKLEQKELARMIAELEKQMKAAARELEFERAALLRDQVYELRAMLADESDLPPWKKVQLLSGGQQ